MVNVKSDELPTAILKAADGLTFSHVDARGNYYFNCPECGSHDNLGLKSENGLVLYNCWCGWCGGTRGRVLDQVGAAVKPKVPKPRKKSAERPKAVPGQVIDTYPYRDAAGVVRFRKLRLEPKDFRIEYRVEIPLKRGRELTGEVRELWVKARPTKPYSYYIYNYPEVLGARDRGDLVFLVDGEKDANTLTRAGLVATCVPFGNGADRDDPSRTNLPQWARSQLSGVDIAIVIDRDENGKGYRAAMKQVRELYGQVAYLLEATHGKDTTDHYSAGGTVHTMRRLTVSEVRERAGEQ